MDARPDPVRAARGAALAVVAALALACTPAPQAPPATTGAQRIISCAPNLTEILFALGVGDRVIGVTRYCVYPPEAAELPQYGDLYNPSLEAMVAARPDLIVLRPGNSKVIDYFRRRGSVGLLETTSCETLEEIREATRLLGATVGCADRAEELIAADTAAIAAVAQECAGRPRLRVLMLIAREPESLGGLWAIGGGVFVTELLEAAGGENVLGTDLGLYPQLSREALPGLAPDVVLEFHQKADDEEARAEIQRAWEPMKGLVPAAATGRLYVVADPHVTIPGADLGRDARRLAELLERARTDAP